MTISLKPRAILVKGPHVVGGSISRSRRLCPIP